MIPNPGTAPNRSELTDNLSILMYMHCNKCLAERPKDQSPREYAQLDVGFTRQRASGLVSSP